MHNLNIARIFVLSVLLTVVPSCSKAEPDRVVGEYSYTSSHYQAALTMLSDGVYRLCTDECVDGRYRLYSMNDEGGRVYFDDEPMSSFMKSMGGGPEIGVRDGVEFETIPGIVRYGANCPCIDITGMGDNEFRQRR